MKKKIRKSNSEREVLQHKILAVLRFDIRLKLREYSEFEIVALREKYFKHLLRFLCKMYYLLFSFTYTVILRSEVEHICAFKATEDCVIALNRAKIQAARGPQVFIPVFLLLRPKDISFFLSYLNLVVPVMF